MSEILLMFLLFLCMVAGGFVPLVWLFRLMQLPHISVKGDLLSIKNGSERPQFNLSSIDHFLTVSTHSNPLAGGGLAIVKKELFWIDASGKKNLAWSRDPIGMLSRPYERWVCRLAQSTGKIVESAEFFEDLDGNILSKEEYDNVVKEYVHTGRQW
jgi:hypothetical protein